MTHKRAPIRQCSSLSPAVVFPESTEGERRHGKRCKARWQLHLRCPGEVRAVVAHELGHVWMFTHHPYLPTEMLANEVALRVVDRQVLEQVYEKVWKRIGTIGTLEYLPEQKSK